MVERLVVKVLKLCVFSDVVGKMNFSLQDVGGGLFVVSQFMLVVDVSGGNWLSFLGVVFVEQGCRFYEYMLVVVCCQYLQVVNGEFGVDMQVYFVNDGFVIILMWMN